VLVSLTSANNQLLLGEEKSSPSDGVLYMPGSIHISKDRSRARYILQVKLRNAKILKNYNGIPIRELNGNEFGKEIYVIGSGPSMDNIKQEDLEGKVSISCNRIHKRFKCKYNVQIHQYKANDIPDDIIPVLSRRDAGYFLNINHMDRPFYYFEHYSNHGHGIDFRALDENDKLVVGSSVIHSAIHLAHYLGASKIIILGHDCKDTGTKSHFDGYNNDYDLKWKLQTHYNSWIRDTASLISKLEKLGTQIEWRK